MNFSVNPKIIVGNDCLNILKTLNTSKVFFVTDPFITKSKMINFVIDKLPKNSKYEIFDSIEPDPAIELIELGTSKMKEYQPDLIISIGGGSAIDATKSMIYKLHQDKIYKSLFIAIPTTAGTGSEVTNFSVITIGKEKKVLISDLITPDYSLLLPYFTKSVPKEITIDTGMDVLTHALESYVSKEASLFTDAINEKVIKIVLNILPKVANDGDRMSLREQMMEASCMAGIAFTNAGLGIGHSLAHALGGRFHISHGRLNAILLPYILKYNIENSEEVKYKIQNLAIDLNLNSIESFVSKIKELNDILDIPSKLRELKIINELEFYNSLDEMANSALNDRCTSTNPSVVTKFDFINILRDSY